MDQFSFLPDAARGAALDRAMHDALRDSLAHIAAQAAGPAPHLTELITPAVQALAAGETFEPDIFGLYFELASAIFDRDDALARWAADRIAKAPRARGLQIASRGDADVAVLDEVLDRRLAGEGLDFLPVDAGTLAAFSSLLHEGLDLMARGAPALHGEVTSYLRRILCATDAPGAKMSFDGASHYQFWGLLLLNPRHHKTPLAVAEVLAHEAGHSLLFGMTIDQPLTLNDDEELFTSPLRTDPRPMDGIYHATFVSARMAWVMETLADSGLLSAADRDIALTEAAKDRANFASGYQTVAAHGKLSDNGSAIMENARAWVEGD